MSASDPALPLSMRPSFPVGAGERQSVNLADLGALLIAVRRCIEGGEGFTVATLNLDHLVKLRGHQGFRNAYRAARFVVADGNPVVWLARLAGRPVGLVPGSESIEPLCATAAAEGWPIALYGTRPAVIAAAAARLSAAYPDLRIVFAEAPPLGFDPEGLAAVEDARRIDRSGARLCFLALGSPKQEIFAQVAHGMDHQTGE